MPSMDVPLISPMAVRAFPGMTFPGMIFFISAGLFLWRGFAFRPIPTKRACNRATARISLDDSP